MVEPLSLAGKVVAVTAERRAHQQLKYLADRGAETRWAPVLRTIDGRTEGPLVESTDRLIAEPPDVFVVQTGQGLKWWLDGLTDGDEGPGTRRAAVVDALKGARVLSRGGKATSAARQAGLTVEWQAPEETIADVVAFLASTDLKGKRVAVQLDGNDDQAVVETARAQGADVEELDVYRYALPHDVESIVELVEELIAGDVDAVTFTASPAIRQLRAIAAEAGKGDALDAVFTGEAASIAVVVGPVCAETARDAGWTAVVEPETARLMPMLACVQSALARPGS